MKVYLVISEDFGGGQYNATESQVLKVFTSRSYADKFSQEYLKKFEGVLLPPEVTIEEHDLHREEVKYSHKYELHLVTTEGLEMVGTYSYYGGAQLAGNRYLDKGKCSKYYIKDVKVEV